VEGVNRIPWWIWLILAMLLSLATARLPYGYYTFLRITVCAFTALIAFAGWGDGTISRTWSIAFIAIAILFNPLIPIHLKRTTWFYVDLIAACVILAHLLFMRVGVTKSS
jgi:Family of unknown function (DUF6804)